LELVALSPSLRLLFKKSRVSERLSLREFYLLSQLLQCGRTLKYEETRLEVFDEVRRRGSDGNDFTNVVDDVPPE